MIFVLVVVAAALLAQTASVVFAGRVVLRSSERLHTVQHPQVTAEISTELRAELDAIGVKIGDLRIAVSEGIAGYQRHEKRVQKTVAGARKLLREGGLEHAGLEAEVDELREFDAGGSEEEQLRLMPAQVEDRGRTGIPGVSHEDLDRLKAALNG